MLVHQKINIGYAEIGEAQEKVDGYCSLFLVNIYILDIEQMAEIQRL